MNVYVMADLEGISGIYTREQVTADGGRHAEARKYMTEDINAVVSGLKAAGVDKIYVRDCHGGSYTVLWDRLSEAVDYYACGMSGEVRFPGIEECDAVILLGYHAMAGTHEALLEHTFSSKTVQNVFVNGVKVGEVALDAAIAGEHGKPIIMVSGDDKVCEEAKAFLPEVVCAEVKKSTHLYGALLLPQKKAHNLLYNKAIEAVENYKNCKTFTFDKPMKCEIEMMERNASFGLERRPYLKVVDGRTCEVECDTIEQFVARMF